MLRDFLQRFRSDDSTQLLYNRIVAQARQPVFYAEFGVPDTLDGRFDMIVLHIAILMRRLRREGKAGRDTTQALTEAFFADMDRSLREMGVGDLVVPKRVRKMAEAFYGRASAYERALNAEDGETLEAALTRNILGQGESSDRDAARLAVYVRRAVSGLEGQSFERIAASDIAWPDPGEVSTAPSEE